MHCWPGFAPALQVSQLHFTFSGMSPKRVRAAAAVQSPEAFFASEGEAKQKRSAEKAKRKQFELEQRRLARERELQQVSEDEDAHAEWAADRR